MKRLFEINTNSLGESYVRAYVWAENEDLAVLMFRRKHPELQFVSLRALFAADSPTFITNASDSGFELELNLVEPAPAFGVVGTTIRLRSGCYLDLVAPQPDQFTFSDIAGALSKLCRFGGQINSFYSVAEHSFHCAHLAMLDGHSVDVQRAVLMHDAAEAFIGDIVKPLKLQLPQVEAIERSIENVIAAKYGSLGFAAYESIIREIDQAMLIHERRQLFSGDEVTWAGKNETRKVPDKIALLRWDAPIAEACFIICGKTLGIEVQS